MAQSLAKIYLHIVFSTKYREEIISGNAQKELYAYMAKVLMSFDSKALIINGMSDHIHILCTLSRKYSVAKIVEEVKKRSSKWIKTKGEKYESFYWQNGYAVFSVSQSRLETTRNYISRQQQHHGKIAFMDEYRDFLDKNDVAFDERFVWD